MFSFLNTGFIQPVFKTIGKFLYCKHNNDLTKNRNQHVSNIFDRKVCMPSHLIALFCLRSYHTNTKPN